MDSKSRVTYNKAATKSLHYMTNGLGHGQHSSTPMQAKHELNCLYIYIYIYVCVCVCVYITVLPVVRNPTLLHSATTVLHAFGTAAHRF